MIEIIRNGKIVTMNETDLPLRLRKALKEQANKPDNEGNNNTETE